MSKKILKNIDCSTWDTLVTPELQQASTEALESGKILWLPQLPYIFRDDDAHFKLVSVPLPYLALVLALILIYDLSCVRLCKQELKQFVNINPNL